MPKKDNVVRHITTLHIPDPEDKNDYDGGEYRLVFTPGNHQYRVQRRLGLMDSGAEKWEKARKPISVTGITGMLDKPGLVYWASKLTADYVMTHLVNPDTGLLKPGSRESIDGIYTRAKKQHVVQLEEAGRIGTMCHGAVECFLKTGRKFNQTKDRPVPAVNAFKQFVKWWNSPEIKGGKVHATEQRLYHPQYNYCGTVDIVAEIRGGLLYIIDVKTSNDFHSPEMPMQLAAYAAAYEVIEGVKVDGIGIIRLDKVTGMSYWKDYTYCRDDAFDMFTKLCGVRELMKEVK